MVSKLIKKMLVNSELLQGLAFLDLSARMDVSPSLIKKVSSYFPDNVVANNTNDQLHDEFLEYQLADDHGLSVFKPCETMIDTVKPRKFEHLGPG